MKQSLYGKKLRIYSVKILFRAKTALFSAKMILYFFLENCQKIDRTNLIFLIQPKKCNFSTFFQESPFACVLFLLLALKKREKISHFLDRLDFFVKIFEKGLFSTWSDSERKTLFVFRIFDGFGLI